MSNKFDDFDDALDKFLKDGVPEFDSLSFEEIDAFEVALLLKEKKLDPKVSKTEIFEKTIGTFKELKKQNNPNILAIVLGIFELLFDASPLNNNEHLTFDQVYKSSDRTFYKIKFSSYLHSRQFLYNYIWSSQVPLGLETLH